MKTFTTSLNKRHRSGYAAAVSTISLSLLLMVMALTLFRETRQSQRAQAKTQLRIDYAAKERAFLRALVDITPNMAMRGMMTDSSNPATRDSIDWNSILTEALARADISAAGDMGDWATLGIPANSLSANVGNASLTVTNLASSPNGNGALIMRDDDGALADFPTQMHYPLSLGFANRDRGAATHPVVTNAKRYTNQSDDTLFTLEPYPNISFGYREQGTNFIAKRNWWAFTLNFGSESAVTSGLAPAPRTYVLSIYEVPSQLALSSSTGTTTLGVFADGTRWDANGQITVASSVFAIEADIADTTLASFDSTIASKSGVNLSSGTSLDNLVDRRTESAQNNQFLRYSNSGDSGLVSFIPINRGLAFFDYTLTNADTNHHFSTGWNEYSLGARQTAMRFMVTDSTGSSHAGDQSPTRFSSEIIDDNGNSILANDSLRGATWPQPGQAAQGGTNGWNEIPAGNDWFIQDDHLPDGRPYISLDLGLLPIFLARIGAAGVDVNNSLYIGPDSLPSVRPANFPAGPDDLAVVLTGTADLGAYSEGFSIVTPYRVYYAEDFNQVPATNPPAGVTLPWFPPVSVFSPEKRFGITAVAGEIAIDGSLSTLSDGTTGGSVNPLDLRAGGNDAVNTGNIAASLSSIDNIEDLPPITAMNWLVTIEEVHN